MRRYLTGMMLGLVLAGCGDRQAPLRYDSVNVDSLYDAVFTKPEDLDISEISGFLVAAESGDKAYLIPLDLDENPTDKIILLDTSNFNDFLRVAGLKVARPANQQSEDP